MRDGTKNLIPFSKRSKEEATEMGRKGGVRSGKTRRERKSLREGLKLLLSGKLEKDTPLYRQAKTLMRQLGVDGEPTGQNLLEMGIFKKAMKGDSFAFATIRDTIGEKPTETYEDVTPQSPIVLGLIPTDKVAEAKRRHEERINNEEE